MIVGIVKKFIAFVKGLPVIRDIPGFNSLPPRITASNLRFYKLGNLVYTLGMFVHMLWVWLFAFLYIYPMMIINIFSVAVYIVNIIINRRGYHYLAAFIMIAEIITHQMFAVQMLGWAAGFQHYIMVIALLPFLMPRGRWIEKSAMLAGCLLAYIFIDYYMKHIEPSYKISDDFIIFFSLSNIVFAFISMDISGAYFNIAMHETEEKLEQKTEELVEAEKKATLGRVATQMAHEIQNPLNFVNNYSRLNEELVAELREELEKTNLGEEARELLNTLVSNSERIHHNGKRVSEIVKTLQEQVSKK